MNEYQQFLESKRHTIGNFGFNANYIPDIAFDFQKYVKAIGIELKDSYFKQAKLNLQEAEKRFRETVKQETLF